MDKIDKILRNEGLQYTTIDYQGEKCYLIDSLKLYLYIREDKNSEVFRDFRAIVPTGYYFIWFTKAQVEKLNKIRALKDEKVRKELSIYQNSKKPTLKRFCFLKSFEYICIRRVNTNLFSLFSHSIYK